MVIKSGLGLGLYLSRTRGEGEEIMFHLKQSEGDDVASCRQHAIQSAQRVQTIGIEHLRIGHVIEARVAIADVVSNQGHPEEHWFVVELVSLNRIN